MARPDDILVLLDDPQAPDGPPSRTWKIAVIDDDRAVHEGTRFVLAGYSLNGNGIDLLSATSAAEGRDLLRRHPDIAVVLLDVVMETESAGLDLVEYIRRDLGNELVRIVLRTGQPGQAPERSVIVDYDINDYKAKTELTADKFFTTITAALRSYEQLARMAETRRGLEIVLDATSRFAGHRSLQQLAGSVLGRIAAILGVDCSGAVVLREPGAATTAFTLLAGPGPCGQAGAGRVASLAPEVEEQVAATFAAGQSIFDARLATLFVSTESGRQVVVAVETERALSDTDRSLVAILCGRLGAAFDVVSLYEQLQGANSRLERHVEERTGQLAAANRRLEAQWQRARRANAFQSEVLGTVAHDLKNPLSVILGRTEILSDLLAADPVPIEQARAQLGHIRESARRLTAMSDTLIADAMADALDISVRREPADMVELTADVVEANRPLADRKQQTIAFSGSGPLSVRADHDRMREAVDNLVSNAIKYSPVGGRIDVLVDRIEGLARVQVIDSGPGLLPEDRARLFGRFQRLSARPTAGESSTGLGLSIAKRIVDLHDGSLTADEAPGGRGTNFVLTLAVMEDVSP
jgi:signal transduction histidine kinase